MGILITKEVQFNGSTLMAVQTEDGKIHVGVRWICQGLGLNDNQRIAQAKKIREDIVLSKGVIKKLLPTSNGKQEVLCIELDFLPLWLAKINANIIDDPVVQDNLVDYQINAAKVLAKAFVREERWEPPKSGYKKMDTELRRRNANVREANMYYKLADKFPYNFQNRSMLYAKAVEVLTGQQLIPDVVGSLFNE